MRVLCAASSGLLVYSVAALEVASVLRRSPPWWAGRPASGFSISTFFRLCHRDTSERKIDGCDKKITPIEHGRLSSGHFGWSNLLWAWLAATLFSGIPSTLYALGTGADTWEATRAAGAMLVAHDSTFPSLLAAAALAYGTVSFLWASLLILVLPPRRVALWAVTAAAAIAVIVLQLIAPMVFPEVAVLPFWPQFADHLMWGACLGLTLQIRSTRAIKE